MSPRGLLSKARRVRTRLMDGAAGLGEVLLQRKRAEGLLVLGEVVAEDVPQCLGLLRAEVDALEVADVDLFGALLRHGAEDEEEVPDAHAYLDAVGVALAVVFGGGDFEGRLAAGRWVGLAHSMASCCWCGL